MYPIDELIQAIKWYYSGCSAAEISEKWASSFSDQQVPLPQTVLKWVKQFEKYGCLQNCRHCKGESSTDPKNGLGKGRKRTREVSTSICEPVESTSLCTIKTENEPCLETTSECSLSTLDNNDTFESSAMSLKTEQKWVSTEMVSEPEESLCPESTIKRERKDSTSSFSGEEEKLTMDFKEEFSPNEDLIKIEEMHLYVEEKRPRYSAPAQELVQTSQKSM